MKLSKFFLPTLKETPQEAQVVSHRLMLRSGMIRQLSAGIYNWLPLGLMALKNIEQIVREEMKKAGANELLMPTIQPAELWQESGRYEAYGKEMLRIKDRHDHEMLYGPTNEEVITDIFRKHIKSYKELPMNLYQIQWKFRDEIRPRFGVMRGREFFMKDAYSFDISFEAAKQTYELMYETYFKIFKRMGLQAVAVKADSGPIGGDLSHEFQIIAETGESEIYYDAKLEELAAKNTVDIAEIQSIYAAAEEKHDPNNCPVPKDRLKKARGIEVGHIFYSGTKYTDAMNVAVTNEKGAQVKVECGCYGIGISRLVAAIIEASHDERGIIWPESVAPFQISLINLKPGNKDCDRVADEIYEKLQIQGKSILYDDTEDSAGAKFANHDLIGSPYQIIIGPKSVAEGMVEAKRRTDGEKEKMTINDLEKFILNAK